MTNTKTSKAAETVEVGTLIARTEAPGFRYRITSTIPHLGAKMFRALPYRAQGRELAISVMGSLIAADGSMWKVVGRD